MQAAAAAERTRPMYVQAGGRRMYLGRAPVAEARVIEAAARDELARTGRVAGARSVQQARGCVVRRDDPVLWSDDDGAPDELARELRLMLAVLEDARRVLGRTTASAEERLEAEAWFASDDRSHLYAFGTICDVFGVDPEVVRRGLCA